MQAILPYRSTSIFDAETLPIALRKEHRTKPGVWGLVRVLEGQLMLSFPDGTEQLLSSSAPGLLLPDQPHWVTPLGAMRMRVEFYNERPLPLGSNPAL
ncbi:DUF1971 domain-containing protein [Sphingomonas sp. JC676]|uniref:DUF1971 domain-containing protein n=1 Tax=Sphingomonas sp. JC676 TaxID=2768065 RepID=UPI001657C958|nr:DUF1971 domain-containing protein [Sphingomonas sp. JC676]MBC9030791.1 DUF1971 domain-containing protein [Sphingomonas sp. JC676]